MGPAPGQRTGILALLAVTTVLFLLSSLVLAAMYVGERDTVSKRDKTISSLESDLETLRQQNDELSETLSELEGKTISGEAYDTVKACVEQGADLEKAMEAYLNNPSTATEDEITTATVDFMIMENCTNALANLPE